MDIKDLPKINPGGGTGVQALFDKKTNKNEGFFKGMDGAEIETDAGWDEGYEKQTDTNTGTEQADREKLTQVNGDNVDEQDDGAGKEGAETDSERALQLLSAIETACRDLQKHEFSHEDQPEEARCPTILHRLLWLFSLEVCGRDAGDITRWAAAPHPNSPNIFDRDQVSRLADLVVPGD